MKVALPFPLLTAQFGPFVLSLDGTWLVAGREGCTLVADGRATLLTLEGEPTAGCTDGHRAFIALCRTGTKRTERLASSIVVIDGGVARTWCSLKALGGAAKPVTWMTFAQGALIVSTSLAMEPTGGGWALHQLAETGKVTKSIELASASYRGFCGPVRRVGAMLHLQKGDAVPLDLSTHVVPATERRAVFADREASTRGDWSEEERKPIVTLTVTVGGRIAFEVVLDGSPDHVAIGEGWVAWTTPRKLFVRTDDGEVSSPSTGGRIDAMASSAAELALLVRGSGKSHLLIVRPLR